MGADRFFRHGVAILFWGVTGLFAALLLYLMIRGALSWSGDLLSRELAAPIAGTLLLVLLTVAIALPVGVATGIYLQIYAGPRMRAMLGLAFEILASIPSIVVGLFGFSMLLALHRLFPDLRSSLLLAALSLALLVLPYLVQATRLGLEETPREYLSVAAALGASREDLLRRIQLPHAGRHILKGVFLAVARSAEDTAVILLTGVVASYGLPDGLGRPFEALPFHIYYTTANYDGPEELRSVFMAVLVLMAVSAGFMALTGGLGRLVYWRRRW
jgi:phosphate transport system permease protein